MAAKTLNCDVAVLGELAVDGPAQVNDLAVAGTLLATVPTTLLTGTLPAGRMPAHTGDVTSSTGSVALTIAGDAVTNSKLANVSSRTIKGRVTAATGDPEDLTGAQARDVLDLQAVYKLADESVSGSSTLQADDHLSRALTVGVWEITGHVVANVDSASTGIKLALVGSGGLVLAAGSRASIDVQSSTALTLLARGILTAFDGSASVGGVGPTGDLVVTIAGTVDVTTAGTLTLQWAQSAANGKFATTVYKYSRLHFRKLN